MTPERWQQINHILEEIDAAPARAHAAILARIGADDPDLRSQVEYYLSEAPTDAFIVGAIGTEAATLGEPAKQREKFGHYQAVRLIGHGGMGAVYEAVRVDDFHKKVALKVIKQGLDSDHARSRFLQERQTLATLEHPNIARLLDGGETEDSSPYLVLEFVDGVPITQYCAGLGREARLRLFLKVCEAVEYAHRNLIVHRDLKPANILVTAAGEPKLLDFGIAKLLDSGSPQTQTGVLAMTPEYASPEQVKGEPITTASDVYSLGVILYQLLTGRKPYDIGNASVLDLYRVVCQQPPADPGLGDELDQILLMALRKEPARRYAGVQRLAEDIARYLQHRPVSAKADTLRYRASKFFRRYWWQLAGAAGVASLLIGAAVISTMQARRAERRFEDVRQLANAFIIDVNGSLQGASTQTREHIVKTTLPFLEKLSSEAGDDPKVLTDLSAAYAAIGSIQSSFQGKVEEARSSYVRAIALGEKLLAKPGSASGVRKSLAAAYLGLLEIDIRHGELPQAAALGNKAIATAEAAEAGNGWSRRFLINAYTSSARPPLEAGHPLKALPLLQKALKLAEEELAKAPGDELRFRIAVLHHHIGEAFKNSGNLPDGIKQFDIARTIIQSLANPEDARYGSSIITLLCAPGSSWAAGPADLNTRLWNLSFLKEGLDLAVRRESADPQNSAIRNSKAICLVARGMLLKQSDRPAAYRSFQEAIRINEQLLASDPGSSVSRGNLAGAELWFGEALVETEDLQKGLPRLRRGTEFMEGLPNLLLMDRRRLIEGLLLLGAAETRAREYASARSHVERSLALSLALWPEAKEDLRSFSCVGRSYAALGELERASGQTGKACEAFRRSLDTWERWTKVGASSFYDQEQAAKVRKSLVGCAAGGELSR